MPTHAFRNLKVWSDSVGYLRLSATVEEIGRMLHGLIDSLETETDGA